MVSMVCYGTKIQNNISQICTVFLGRKISTEQFLYVFRREIKTLNSETES
jgi:hypothetical protein